VLGLEVLGHVARLGETDREREREKEKERESWIRMEPASIHTYIVYMRAILENGSGEDA
jgi:hypothetical protein